MTSEVKKLYYSQEKLVKIIPPMNYLAVSKPFSHNSSRVKPAYKENTLLEPLSKTSMEKTSEISVSHLNVPVSQSNTETKELELRKLNLLPENSKTSEIAISYLNIPVPQCYAKNKMVRNNEEKLTIDPKDISNQFSKLSNKTRRLSNLFSSLDANISDLSICLDKYLSFEITELSSYTMFNLLTNYNKLNSLKFKLNIKSFEESYEIFSSRHQDYRKQLIKLRTEVFNLKNNYSIIEGNFGTDFKKLENDLALLDKFSLELFPNLENINFIENLQNLDEICKSISKRLSRLKNP